MSLDLANHIVDVIMSYEDPSSSEIALKVFQDRSTSMSDVKCHKLDRINPCLSGYSNLFKCHNDIPFYCLFSLDISVDLTTFFKLVANPSRSVFESSQHCIQSDIVWFQTIINRLKEQTGNGLFEELYQSVLIDFSIKFSNDVGEILLNFSKHSLYLGKNIHFEIHLDMVGNLKSVNFRSYTYNDNYQPDIIKKFKPKNQIVAFHLFLSYYCYPLVHQELDSLIDISMGLNDSNLHNYENIMNMIKI